MQCTWHTRATFYIVRKKIKKKAQEKNFNAIKRSVPTDLHTLKPHCDFPEISKKHPIITTFNIIEFNPLEKGFNEIPNIGIFLYLQHPTVIVRAKNYTFCQNFAPFSSDICRDEKSLNTMQIGVVRTTLIFRGKMTFLRSK